MNNYSTLLACIPTVFEISLTDLLFFMGYDLSEPYLETTLNHSIAAKIKQAPKIFGIKNKK